MEKTIVNNTPKPEIIDAISANKPPNTGRKRKAS
jgi:hypothetical protein